MYRSMVAFDTPVSERWAEQEVLQALPDTFAKYALEDVQRALMANLHFFRLANRTACGVFEFGRSVSGCPCGGRQFGDSTDWKITQSRQDGTQIGADRDFEPPAGFDH
jgi:hypothetical protein